MYELCMNCKKYNEAKIKLDEFQESLTKVSKLIFSKCLCLGLPLLAWDRHLMSCMKIMKTGILRMIWALICEAVGFSRFFLLLTVDGKMFLTIQNRQCIFLNHFGLSWCGQVEIQCHPPCVHSLLFEGWHWLNCSDCCW